jgi:hypothetical protein
MNMIFSAMEREGPKESLHTTHKIEEESEISFLVVGLIIDQVFHCPRGLRNDYRGHLLLLLQFCL